MPNRKTIERDILGEIRKALEEDARETTEEGGKPVPKIRLRKTLESQGIDSYLSENILKAIERRRGYRKVDFQPLLAKVQKRCEERDISGDVGSYYAHCLTPKQIIDYIIKEKEHQAIA